jgi:hypothetical protein
MSHTGERFLLVSDEPPMNTVELGSIAQVRVSVGVRVRV